MQPSSRRSTDPEGFAHHATCTDLIIKSQQPSCTGGLTGSAQRMGAGGPGGVAERLNATVLKPSRLGLRTDEPSHRPVLRQLCAQRFVGPE